MVQKYRALTKESKWVYRTGEEYSIQGQVEKGPGSVEGKQQDGPGRGVIKDQGNECCVERIRKERKGLEGTARKDTKEEQRKGERRVEREAQERPGRTGQERRQNINEQTGEEGVEKNINSPTFHGFRWLHNLQQDLPRKMHQRIIKT
jgi:hypothetical protein